jgi:signal peptidase I
MWLLRAVWLWLQVVGGAVTIAAVLWLGVQSLFHLRLLDVQTGSMRPSFVPGDALVMQSIGGEVLQPGMVVSYRSSRNPNELITHRVVRVLPATHSFQTKGDALTVADPVVRDSLLVGHITTVLPGMGRIFDLVRSWPGLILLVYLPVTAISIQELYRLERVYFRSRLYRLYEKQMV